MRARREPLVLEVVHSGEAVDMDKFLRMYIGALLAEVRREPIEMVEEASDETITIPPERKFGLLAYIA
ncbi:MAG: hypothetical protein M3O61_13635 [Gemmatimonadota bacterium]|nr:hypothetical protein [Gemmatimonadota bacterium]